MAAALSPADDIVFQEVTLTSWHKTGRVTRRRAVASNPRFVNSVLCDAYKESLPKSIERYRKYGNTMVPCSLLRNTDSWSRPQTTSKKMNGTITSCASTPYLPFVDVTTKNMRAHENDIASYTVKFAPWKTQNVGTPPIDTLFADTLSLDTSTSAATIVKSDPSSPKVCAAAQPSATVTHTLSMHETQEGDAMPLHILGYVDGLDVKENSVNGPYDPLPTSIRWFSHLSPASRQRHGDVEDTFNAPDAGATKSTSSIRRVSKSTNTGLWNASAKKIRKCRMSERSLAPLAPQFCRSQEEVMQIVEDAVNLASAATTKARTAIETIHARQLVFSQSCCEEDVAKSLIGRKIPSATKANDSDAENKKLPRISKGGDDDDDDRRRHRQHHHDDDSDHDTKKIDAAEAKVELSALQPNSDLPEKWNSARSLLNVACSFGMSLTWIKDAYNEFTRYFSPDELESGLLTISTFKTQCRARMSTVNEAIVREAAKTAFKDVDVINFNDFLVWYTSHSFLDCFSSTSVGDIERRKLGVKFGIALIDVEKLHHDFHLYDKDRSGTISLSEFKSLLCLLLRVPEANMPADRVDRAWTQAHVSGELDFEHFLLWYSKYMYDSDHSASAIEVIRGISLPVCSRDKSLKFSAL